MSHLFGSQTSLREANRSALLSCIRKFGSITQIELAEATGLSTATVSTLVRQLVDEQRLYTENTIRNGRRATLVTLARREGVSVGIHIGLHHFNLVLIDTDFNIIAERSLPLPWNHQPDVTLDRARILISETLESVHATTKELISIGISIAAPIDKRRQTIAVDGIMPNWQDIDIKSIFQETFNIPITIDNDANCCAVWEGRVGSATRIENFVYVNTTDGVGSAIIANGKLWKGVTGLAGEIGHIQVDPLGSICSCGNRGCLNTFVDERRIISLLTVTHGKLTMDDLIQLANTGDPGCRRVIADTALRIGTVTAELCTCVDPEVVVVGGRLAKAGNVFIDAFSSSLHRLLFPEVLSPIQVITASNLTNCSALGAALESIDLSENSSISQTKR